MVLTKSTDIHLRASADGSKEHKQEAEDRTQVPGSYSLELCTKGIEVPAPKCTTLACRKAPASTMDYVNSVVQSLSRV